MVRRRTERLGSNLCPLASVGKLRKVVLSRSEVVRILLAFNGAEQPQRSGTSHVKYFCWVRGVKKSVTIDASISEFPPDSYSALWFIVQKQLEVSWDDFYAADPDVAKRASVNHRIPATGLPAS